MRSKVLLDVTASLLPIRRALVITVLFGPWAQMALTLFFNRGDYTTEVWGFYVYTAIYALLAILTTQRMFALLGPVLPALLLVIPWFIEGNSWINVNVAAMASVALAAFVLRPMYAIGVGIALSVLFLAIVQADLPTVLTTGAMFNNGVFHVVQIMAASFLVAGTWKKLNEHVSIYDNAFSSAERQLLSMRLRHDRLVHWRRVSSRLHGNVLDLLSKVQTSGVIERVDLSKALADLHDARALQYPQPRIVVEDVARDFLGRLDVEFIADQATAESATDMATAELLRDSLYEFCIAARHAGATRVIVLVRNFPDRLVAVFTDDSGRQSANVQVVGDFAILRERLRAAGATLTFSQATEGEFSLSLVIPSASETVVKPPTSDFRWKLSTSGERMVASIMLSVVVSSTVVAVLLQTWWQGSVALSLVWASMCGLLVALFFASKTRLDAWRTSVIAALALGAVLLTATYEPSCATISPIHYIANSTGYGLLILFFLGHRVVASVSVVLWFVSVGYLVDVLPDTCESVAWYAVANTLTLVPIGLFLLYVSISTYKFARERSVKLEKERVTAVKRDEMVHEIVSGTEVLLQEADSLIQSLALSPNDSTLRHQLRIVESRLRIRAQVDPLIAGATARTLIAFVDEVAARGNWIDIGTVSGSQYQVEPPEEVLDAAMAIAHIIGSGRKLNFVTTDSDEIVSHTLTRDEAVQVADLFVDWDMTNSGWRCGDVQVDLDLSTSEDPNAPVLIVWSRPIRRVPGLGIPDRRSRARV